MVSNVRSGQTVFKVFSKIKKALAISLLMILMLFPRSTQCGPLYPACMFACKATCIGIAIWLPVTVIGTPACIAQCFLTCIASCFHKNTTIQVLENDKAIEKNVADVHIGDMVGTLHNGAFTWTKVVRNIKKTGDFDFVQITANNETTGNHKELSVTPTHGMVLLGDDNQIMLDTANNVVIGDKIAASNGEVLTVTNIVNGTMDEQYTLETAEGTVIASGMFVSTLCAEELEGGKKPFNATIEDWQYRHRDILK